MAWEPLPPERDTTHSLSSSLERLHRIMGLARPDAVKVLENGWRSLLGPRLAGVCRLESIHDGRLTVAVDDPAVAEALRWQSADLVAAANAMCGGEVIDSVQARVRPPDR